MSNPLDYSKWDKIDCSSSDDEEQENLGAPRVTRLDAPSRVTRTSNGDLVVEEQEQKIEEPLIEELEVSAKTATSNSTAKGPPNETLQNTTNIPASWTEHGSQETLTISQQTLYWSQDRQSVCLRLSLPTTSLKGKDIRVQLQGVRRYADRNCAVGSESPSSIRVTTTCTADSQVLLEGEFPHFIHAAEDDDDFVDAETPYCSSDWAIDRTTGDAAYWVMTLLKAVPMDGMTIWWRRPLTQFDEMEPTTTNTSTEKSQAFQAAWEEAHRQFKDKMKQKQTIP
ncbi:expressed unknown protein [Seminavis robusta]|uniref:CS domain-containing protein n=1 Tax=Seminavis robusta TaxID=568900 RepID=A0A9N8DCM6_9STRA|nr:expressed unknown protein [Seminavis robusta]|eukprot:Sro82_g044020.1 n/a (282) ;mRNA; r:93820-94665